MRKLITLVVLVVFTMVGYAQTAKVGGNEESVKTMVNKGIIEFVIPAEVTTETINKSSTYYTNIFTVDYNEPSRIVKITMIDNNSRDRMIITRFLLSSGIKGIEFMGKQFTIQQFYDEYLK